MSFFGKPVSSTIRTPPGVPSRSATYCCSRGLGDRRVPVRRDGWEPRHPAPEPSADDEQRADGDQAKDSAVEQAPAGPPPISPVALIAAARDIGTPHAQLKPIAEHLSTTTDVVRAAAAGMGWPIKDVRMAGRSASAGLRWDECPSPAPVDPSPGVVGTGRAADDNHDGTGEEGCREGGRCAAHRWRADHLRPRRHPPQARSRRRLKTSGARR
jgi:hypothetical protein